MGEWICQSFGLFCGSSHAARAVPEINGGAFLTAFVIVAIVLLLMNDENTRKPR
jgi:hypothetical protein